MLSLTYWTPKGASGSQIGRIYIQGGRGKSFLVPRGGVVEIHSDSAAEALRLGAVIEAQFGVTLGSKTAWEQLKAACSQPAFGTGARASRGDADTIASASPGRASDDLDFTTSFFVPPGEVVIEIDHREPIEFDHILATIPNVLVERTTLPIADFVLNRQQIYVERKSIADFEASIISEDKRLFNQVERLGFLDNALVIILIEGDWSRFSRMTRPQVIGALSYLSMIKGVSVLPSASIRESAYILTKCAVHSRHGLGYQLALRGAKPAALLDARRFVLEGLPGVSAGLADRLLAHFGSIRRVMSASRAQLLAVDGIGPKTADRIVAILDGNSVESLCREPETPLVMAPYKG